MRVDTLTADDAALAVEIAAGLILVAGIGNLFAELLSFRSQALPRTTSPVGSQHPATRTEAHA